MAVTPKKKPELAPELSALEFARFFWTTLTSMRTAIWLLCALALAAIPGSLGPKILPQRPNNPVMVNEWIANHPTLGPVFDTLGLFDVYGSPWFAAIYLLLLVSMVGCIIPRIALYARQVRQMPSGAPRVLDRLPAYRRGTLPGSASEALDAGERYLTSQRFRVRRDGDELSGEIGYLRELGNLVFHVSILGVLVGILVSSLFGFKGSVIVTEGSAFSNNLSQYDDFTSGALFDVESLKPFTLWVDRFDVEFERGQVQHGAARVFRVNGRVAEGTQPARDTIVEVNTPVLTDGAMVNLIGHGYSPVVTVTDAGGKVAFSGPVVFLPQSGNFDSQGVIKAPDARPKRIGIEGIFVPTQTSQQGTGPRSTFPDADNPALWGTIWTGAPVAESGAAQNVYSLDKAGLTQVQAGSEPASFRLAPGQSYTIPDGSGTLRFDAVKRWTKLQVSSTPGLPIVYGSILVGILGLLLSMFVRPRRVFAKVSTEAGSPVVEVGGLDKLDGRPGLAEAVDGLAGALGLRDVESSPGASPTTLAAASAAEKE